MIAASAALGPGWPVTWLPPAAQTNEIRCHRQSRRGREMTSRGVRGRACRGHPRRGKEGCPSLLLSWRPRGPWLSSSLAAWTRRVAANVEHSTIHSGAGLGDGLGGQVWGYDGRGTQKGALVRGTVCEEAFKESSFNRASASKKDLSPFFTSVRVQVISDVSKFSMSARMAAQGNRGQTGE